MLSKPINLINTIKNQKPFFRRIILIFIDSCLIISGIFINFFLNDTNYLINHIWILPTSTTLGIFIYTFTFLKKFEVTFPH